MKTTHTSKWLLDFTLSAGFIFMLFMDLTGLELQQWMGATISWLAANAR